MLQLPTLEEQELLLKLGLLFEIIQGYAIIRIFQNFEM